MIKVTRVFFGVAFVFISIVIMFGLGLAVVDLWQGTLNTKGYGFAEILGCTLFTLLCAFGGVGTVILMYRAIFSIHWDCNGQMDRPEHGGVRMARVNSVVGLMIISCVFVSMPAYAQSTSHRAPFECPESYTTDECASARVVHHGTSSFRTAAEDSSAWQNVSSSFERLMCAEYFLGAAEVAATVGEKEPHISEAYDAAFKAGEFLAAARIAKLFPKAVKTGNLYSIGDACRESKLCQATATAWGFELPTTQISLGLKKPGIDEFEQRIAEGIEKDEQLAAKVGIYRRRQASVVALEDQPIPPPAAYWANADKPLKALDEYSSQAKNLKFARMKDLAKKMLSIRYYQLALYDMAFQADMTKPECQPTPKDVAADSPKK